MKSKLALAFGLAIGLISVGFTSVTANAQTSQSLEDRVSRLEKAVKDLESLRAPPSSTTSGSGMAPPSSTTSGSGMAPPSSTTSGSGMAPPSSTTSGSGMAPPSSFSAKKMTLKVSGVDDKVKVTTWPKSNTSKVSTVFEGSRNETLDLNYYVSDADENWVVRVELYNVAGPSGVTFQLVTDGNPGEAVSRSCKLWNPGWCVDYQFSINRVSGATAVIKDVTK